MIKRGRRRSPAPAWSSPEGIAGVARVDRRTKNLVARIDPGEIAVIDHRDIDRIAAEGLVQRQVKAVVNASPSASGRYPNLGPLLLCSAGIPVVDDAGANVMDLDDGSHIAIEAGRVFRWNGKERQLVAKGRVLTLADAERVLDASKEGIAEALERFAENTIGYIKEERDVLLEATRLPKVKTAFHGRHVLLVVRGSDYKDDLVALRSYIREVRPLLIGVDGGADALMERGLRPDMIIGDMDSVTTEALVSGAELVVHAYPGGGAPGLERIEALGLEAVVFEATGTSEDITMLMAHEGGAELIVAVGTHANLVEFLDKGRKGMASTFLTRLRVGPILVDAKGVSRLYRPRIRRSDLALLVAAALVTLVVAVQMSAAAKLQLHLIWLEIQNAWFAVRRAIF
ncbi:MAG: putative cytokinetic ring protein SteA [Actinomycetota bacterium]